MSYLTRRLHTLRKLYLSFLYNIPFDWKWNFVFVLEMFYFFTDKFSSSLELGNFHFAFEIGKFSFRFWNWEIFLFLGIGKFSFCFWNLEILILFLNWEIFILFMELGNFHFVFGIGKFSFRFWNWEIFILFLELGNIHLVLGPNRCRLVPKPKH